METKIIKVTDKGQISIPVSIRNSIGIVLTCAAYGLALSINFKGLLCRQKVIP